VKNITAPIFMPLRPPETAGQSDMGDAEVRQGTPQAAGG
jgi:hypothetical protein